jgi:hypothetical protein
MAFPADTPTIQSLTPTVCDLFGIKHPAQCSSVALPAVAAAARVTFGARAAKRVLVFAPDAIGNHLRTRLPDHFAPVLAAKPIEVPLLSVTPSMTPVCFASMFSGAPPSVHGIQKYAKPVLTCDTLFDAAARAGLRVAIVAVADSSIDMIFRNRSVEYFSLKYDCWVTEKALQLMREDRHELIIAYHQEYDDVMHAAGPFARRALRGASNAFAAFTELSEAMDVSWAGWDRALVVSPDHGAHELPDGAGGSHGTSMPEDMEVWHFYSLKAGLSSP